MESHLLSLLKWKLQRRAQKIDRGDNDAQAELGKTLSAGSWEGNVLGEKGGQQVLRQGVLLDARMVCAHVACFQWATGRQGECREGWAGWGLQALNFGKGISRVGGRTVLETDPAGWGRACVRNELQFTSDLITMCGFGMAQALLLSFGILKPFTGCKVINRFARLSWHIPVSCYWLLGRLLLPLWVKTAWLWEGGLWTQFSKSTKWGYGT